MLNFYYMVPVHFIFILFFTFPCFRIGPGTGSGVVPVIICTDRSGPEPDPSINEKTTKNIDKS
jgi:hypothetical protein